jgi:hypothetical protein
MEKDEKGSRAYFPLHIDRNHLPEPEWNFPNAKVGIYATESTPYFRHAARGCSQTPRDFRLR